MRCGSQATNSHSGRLRSQCRRQRCNACKSAEPGGSAGGWQREREAAGGQFSQRRASTGGHCSLPRKGLSRAAPATHGTTVMASYTGVHCCSHLCMTDCTRHVQPCVAGICLCSVQSCSISLSTYMHAVAGHILKPGCCPELLITDCNLNGITRLLEGHLP
jgi:hypothetical protein